MLQADRERLEDMLWAAEKVLSFTAGKDRSAFDADEVPQFACIRGLEIVGEAASKVTRDTRENADHIAWASIVGMRHRIVHAYADIDMEVVWRTIVDELPALVRALRHVDKW